jgi:hypothetical protein
MVDLLPWLLWSSLLARRVTEVDQISRWHSILSELPLSNLLLLQGGISVLLMNFLSRSTGLRLRRPRPGPSLTR